MAEVARQHHKTLQAEQKMTLERREAIDQLKDLPKLTMTEDTFDELNKEIEEYGVEDAIKQTQNGKSPGKDGIIYGFWKMFPKPKGDEKEEECKK